MSKKLSHYAKERGVTYRTAWNHYRAGKIQGAYLDESGHVVIPDTTPLIEPRVATYARVSSSENRDNLAAQSLRLAHYATARGWKITAQVQEVGSGLNDHRKKLEALLKDPSWNILLVEHKDRLTRFGYHYLDTLLSQAGKRIEVANLADDTKTDLVQDMVSVIYSFSARLYGLRRSKRSTDRILDCLSDLSKPEGSAP